MVLNFSQIPPHLQGKIAEKVDYFDLEELDISSKQGNSAVKFINIMPIVKTSQIWFGAQSGYIHIKRPGSKREIEKEFSSLNDALHLPRFFITKVEVKSYATPQCITHQIFNDSRRFVDLGVRLRWEYTGSENVVIMEKISNLFSVVTFSACAECLNDRLFLSMPVFQNVQAFYASIGTLPDANFLALKAHYITIDKLTSFPHMGPTLQKFFKQYFHNERELSSLEIKNIHSEYSADDMFIGMEHFKLLWSLETHETGDYSYIPKEELGTGMADIKFYLIKGGEKKLIVLVTDYNIRVTPTLDENEDVLAFIAPTTPVSKQS